jgi:hypothetical protein
MLRQSRVGCQSWLMLRSRYKFEPHQTHLKFLEKYGIEPSYGILCIDDHIRFSSSRRILACAWSRKVGNKAARGRHDVADRTRYTTWHHLHLGKYIVGLDCSHRSYCKPILLDPSLHPSCINCQILISQPEVDWSLTLEPRLCLRHCLSSHAVSG